MEIVKKVAHAIYRATFSASFYIVIVLVVNRTIPLKPVLVAFVIASIIAVAQLLYSLTEMALFKIALIVYGIIIFDIMFLANFLDGQHLTLHEFFAEWLLVTASFIVVWGLHHWREVLEIRKLNNEFKKLPQAEEWFWHRISAKSTW